MYLCICFIYIVNRIRFSGGKWELSRRFNLARVSGQSHFSAAEGALELDFPSSSNHHLPAGVWDLQFLPPWKLLQFKWGKTWDESRRKFVLRRCFQTKQTSKGPEQLLSVKSHKLSLAHLPNTGSESNHFPKSLSSISLFQTVYLEAAAKGRQQQSWHGEGAPWWRWDVDTGYLPPFASYTVKNKVKGGKSLCVTDSEHFGLEGTLKAHLIPIPTMGRDTFP